ncbi:branched-chain amino acid ABC transporter permease [Rhodobium gokarnense]|uniref:Branched-chain amino acid transport system permease protein n=1 Tax=Rhodobium gokarnense TaxID=364296 RepID=A0ABT3H925_9HYPH|nr:branched-chain amino acid ABC transporter permease [Rhodobium gokarnense]MCW2306895.1 branched-chain amino acid transport system permease protein [Rhodobium gokarnense]
MVIFVEYAFSGLMLGIMYSLVAVGFTLFFGVLNVINFSHGDVLAVGSFSALIAYVGLQAVGLDLPILCFIAVALAAFVVTGLLGAAIGGGFVVPMRNAPPINVLLMTMMIGTVLREVIRLGYPNGSNPKAFPALLPDTAIEVGSVFIRLDSVILLGLGLAVVALLDQFIRRTKFGLAIRAVAQDGETAQIIGIDFKQTILLTFAIGSGLAGLAGVMHGVYYREVNFSVGLLLGVIGFSAAIIGGLGRIWGAVLGGFVFAALQTLWVILFPDLSGYRDVFAFAMVIVVMTIWPTGMMAEMRSERV